MAAASVLDQLGGIFGPAAVAPKTHNHTVQTCDEPLLCRASVLDQSDQTYRQCWRHATSDDGFCWQHTTICTISESETETDTETESSYEYDSESDEDGDITPPMSFVREQKDSALEQLQIATEKYTQIANYQTRYLRDLQKKRDDLSDALDEVTAVRSAILKEMAHVTYAMLPGYMEKLQSLVAKEKEQFELHEEAVFYATMYEVTARNAIEAAHEEMESARAVCKVLGV